MSSMCRAVSPLLHLEDLLGKCCLLRNATVGWSSHLDGVRAIANTIAHAMHAMYHG